MILESLFALFLGIVGACIKAPRLKEIAWASETKTRCAEHNAIALLTRRLMFGVQDDR